jgi:hypothetical protein
MSETDVTVAWIEIYGFIASKCIYGTRDCKAGKQEIFYNAELLC